MSQFSFAVKVRNHKTPDMLIGDIAGSDHADFDFFQRH